MLSDKEVRISRKMSCGLRHNPEIFGVELGTQVWDGFVPISSVCKALGISREFLDLVVRENSKKRFAVKEDLIRASQGHSVPVDLGCEVEDSSRLPLPWDELSSLGKDQGRRIE